MADADGCVRGETPDIFLDILDERELDHLFEEEVDNIKHEVVSYSFFFYLFHQIIVVFQIFS